MKIASAESDGPILPVWQSLKGFSNRDTVSAPITNPSSQPQLLQRVDSCPIESVGKKYCKENCAFEPEVNALVPYQNPENGIPGIPKKGLSTSTISTTISNPNLAVQRRSIYDARPSVVTTSYCSTTKDNMTLVRDDEEDDFADDAHVFNFLKDIPGLLFTDVYRHTRVNSKKMRRRVVHKTGECNVTQSNVAKRRRRYLQDIFTTLVDMQWRWTLLVFGMSFILSWFIFAILWYSIALFHGDLLPENLPSNQTVSGWTPCVININGFTSCFLFSIETQHTIGYGSRYTTEKCLESIIIMCIQSITGVMIQAFMVGVVFAKLSRPKKRTQTLMFSKFGCICQRDGELCLLFRVGDMRKSHIIEAHIRAQLIRKRVTKEGEVLPFFQYELNVGYDVGEDRIFFIWPMTIVHKIDESSPLYDISAHDLLTEKFEVVVMLEGVIESTGMTTQARSSYLPNEILWGHRFEPLVFFKKDTGEYAVDYSLFNNTIQMTTPLCSAKHLQECKSRNSSPVTPATPITPMSPLTPMTPPIPGFECFGQTQNSAKVKNYNKSNTLSASRSSLARSLSSSSTLKEFPTVGDTFDDDTIAEKYSSLSEVVISQPLLNHSENM